jgi:SAM-dependent methyltransferase
MVRYVTVAMAARFFSLSPATRRSYRALGNAVLRRQRGREGLPRRYVERARYLLETCRRHGILHEGDRILEIGTGWMHWESTILAVFYGVRPVHFDVVDNRLWDVYQLYLRELAGAIDERLEPDPARRARALRLLRELGRATSFENAYEMLGARYVVEPSGSLAALPSDSFTLVVSCDTLEHLPRAFLPTELDEFHRLLVPGGFSVHQIDLADHLAYFDRGATPKHYYRYSHAAWDRWFESGVQHFNRVQRSEWLDLFAHAGFEEVSEEVDRVDVERGSVHADWRHLPSNDLQTTRIRLVSRTAPRR